MLSDRIDFLFIVAVKRTFYDKHNEEKLKEGFFANGSNYCHKIVDLKGGYRFAGNPEEIFESFFGTSNPFAQLISGEDNGSPLSHVFGA